MMEVKIEQYVELRGENPLRAVISRTESNAHLVASAALINGMDATVVQYNLSEAQVYGALAFYHENRDLIEKYRHEADKNIRKIGIDAKEHLEEIRKRKQS
ncbi:MAG: hypothetical protein Q9P01_11310 [Anaerolineae bacterium]|nr:hypothetical protein [Anaerolineae bacterium]MDQ7035392.1 hypothetical protein [Anaerolineae bacterium]